MVKLCLAVIVMLNLMGMGEAEAILYDRGNGLIYDSDQDLTWLQDANYAATSGYSLDGRMGWYAAEDWVHSLVYAGYSGWRLPATKQPDPSCDTQIGFGASRSGGYGCIGSELGYLFYIHLRGEARSSILNATDPNGYLGFFKNIQDSVYWSETP